MNVRFSGLCSASSGENEKLSGGIRKSLLKASWTASICSDKSIRGVGAVGGRVLNFSERGGRRLPRVRWETSFFGFDGVHSIADEDSTADSSIPAVEDNGVSGGA